jgi:PHP family Zn ribbon phosphoesterase
MKLDIFGKHIKAIREKEPWLVFYLGAEDKRRIDEDIIMPSLVKEEELSAYLADLLHQWATTKKSKTTGACFSHAIS